MIRTDYHFGDSKSKIIALAIHNGHDLILEIEENSSISEAARLCEEDPHTGSIAQLFKNSIVVHDSRFCVDLNRSMEKSVYLKPEDCWGLNCRKETLSPKLLYRLHEDHRKWYAMLEYQINRILQFQPELFILDLHSYNHRRGGPHAAPDPQEENPDLIIGRTNLDSRYFPLLDCLRNRLDGQTWQGKKLDCRCDVKFSGGYLSRWINSSFPTRVVCIAIEFKKIWMDEHTGLVDESAFSELKEIFYRQFSDFATTYLSGRFSQI